MSERIDDRPTAKHVAEPVYEVVWPKSARGVQPRRAAARLASLNGARIGFVWDYMFRGDELFPVLERELRRRYDDLDVVPYEAFGNIHGPDEAAVVSALPTRLHERGVDAVVAGNGC
jgi:hypothetical protein